MYTIVFRLTPTSPASLSPDDCSSLVELAGRMTVTPDNAIHQFLHVRLRQPAVETPGESFEIHPRPLRLNGRS